MKVTMAKVEKLMDRADVSYEVAKEALEAADGSLLDAIIALEQDGKFGPNAGQVKTAAYNTESDVSATIVGQAYGAGSTPTPNTETSFSTGDGAEKTEKKGRKSKGKSSAAPGFESPGNQTGGSQPGQGYANGQAPGYGTPGSQGASQAGAGYWYGQNGAYSQGYYGQTGGQRRYKDESTEFEDNAKKFFRWLGRVIHASLINFFEVWRKGERVFYFPVILFIFCFIPWVFWVALALLIIGLFCGYRYHFSGPHLGKKKEETKNGENSDS